MAFAAIFLGEIGEFADTILFQGPFPSFFLRQVRVRGKGKGGRQKKRGKTKICVRLAFFFFLKGSAVSGTDRLESSFFPRIFATHCRFPYVPRRRADCGDFLFFPFSAKRKEGGEWLNFHSKVTFSDLQHTKLWQLAHTQSRRNWRDTWIFPNLKPQKEGQEIQILQPLGTPFQTIIMWRNWAGAIPEILIGTQSFYILRLTCKVFSPTIKPSREIIREIWGWNHKFRG